jgi:IS66 C-terminal element
MAASASTTIRPSARRRAASMYSLIETAKLNGINPQAYRLGFAPPSEG